MTPAGRREAVACGLEKLAAWVREGTGRPLPSAAWPLTFQAASGTEAADLAASLGVRDARHAEDTEEDGWPWEQVTGRVGEVPVRITADAGPVLLPATVTS